MPEAKQASKINNDPCLPKGRAKNTLFAEGREGEGERTRERETLFVGRLVPFTTSNTHRPSPWGRRHGLMCLVQLFHLLLSGAFFR